MLKRLFSNVLFKMILVLFLLYIFLSAIDMMSVAFKLLGKEFTKGLVDVTASPIIALLIGVLVTALVQSSSVTTSMVVGLVSAGTLSVTNAVPMIMGANIGTTITNTIVSIGHVSNKHEFRRAFAGATIHDFFNLLTVAVLFPLELMTGFLSKTAHFFAQIFYGKETLSLNYESPIKKIAEIIPGYLKNIFIKDLGLNQHLAGSLILLLAFIFIFFALAFLVKLMRSLMLGKIERILNEFLTKSAFITIAIGAIVTMMVQSSSITTSLLVPMVATGILSLEAAFPITLGANIGTTITAIMAALVGNLAGLTIAFVHLFFNIAGILLIYPVKRIRRIPIWLAIRLSQAVVRDKKVILYYILGVFFVLPGLLISLEKMFF